MSTLPRYHTAPPQNPWVFALQGIDEHAHFLELQLPNYYNDATVMRALSKRVRTFIQANWKLRLLASFARIEVGEGFANLIASDSSTEEAWIANYRPNRLLTAAFARPDILRQEPYFPQSATAPFSTFIGKSTSRAVGREVIVVKLLLDRHHNTALVLFTLVALLCIVSIIVGVSMGQIDRGTAGAGTICAFVQVLVNLLKLIFYDA